MISQNTAHDEGPSARPATSGGAAEIVFDSVTKHYPGQEAPAVDNLSLTIGAGEICMLVGPSGAGKTTALKLINRLIDFEQGEITIDGRSVRDQDLTELRRGIGYVIQQIGLFPHMTIASNIATVPRLLGWEKDRIRARTSELLELVGLEPEYAKRYPTQLSGGQRQRVGLARALAADPPAMLMDEPFGALDPITRGRLQDEFLRLHSRVRKTVVFVTHDIDEAIKMGDKVCVLREGGRLAQYDPPDVLLAKPVDDFVAEFVGADRGLKRLSLRRLGDLPTLEAPSAKVGDDAAAARAKVTRLGFETLIVVDDDNRPIGWMLIDGMTGSRVEQDQVKPLEAVGTPDMPLRDALSIMLSQTGSHLVVVDEDGRLAGYVSADLISSALAGTDAAARAFEADEVAT
ncbi:MAG: osmoprotectant transport system ATP-binding protein [Thermoleophilaceae bacterium]|nr:osmoprotectant transport system ATP-binding protein [Thermoleophilaceae bacterium]